jgi:hypothetical protein
MVSLRHHRPMRSIHFCGLVLVLGFSLSSCSDMTPMERNKLAKAQSQAPAPGMRGGPIDPSATGIEAPETREMREMQKTARDYRQSANQAQGPERERYLQLAENLEQQIQAMKTRKW